MAVVGGGDCSLRVREMAEELGRLLAEEGHTLICGGLGGVMQAACKGAAESGGTVVGILPGDRKDANPYVGISVATGMSHARNAIIVRSSDAVIALPGEYGTLSEIALALKMNKAVISLGSWDIDGTLRAKDPREAIRLLSRQLRQGIA
ncbi:TIGR00725 family protein [Methanothrix soehngenii]|uniref:TIGR00725 family protein n=1 Tax=Methanothrix soehngenii TaxID=2223 RepID=UPI002FDA6CA6|nr:TIGR00725 family protein [Methanothrix soehngenii]